MRSLVGFSFPVWDLVLSCTEQQPLEFALAGSTGSTQLDANHSAQIQPITCSSPNNVITVESRAPYTAELLFWNHPVIITYLNSVY